MFSRAIMYFFCLHDTQFRLRTLLITNFACLIFSQWDKFFWKTPSRAAMRNHFWVGQKENKIKIREVAPLLDHFSTRQDGLGFYTISQSLTDFLLKVFNLEHCYRKMRYETH